MNSEYQPLGLEQLAMILHELRTPIGVIRLSSTALLRDDLPMDAEMRRGLLRDIQHESNRLSRIVDDLLDLARFQAQRMSLEPERLDVNRLIRDVTKRLVFQWNEHPLTLDLPPDLPPVFADAERVEQVLHNLLSNAVKYSPHGGHVTVQAFCEGRFVQVGVHDQGIGIAPENLERIFERFYRVQDDRLRHIDGVGVGLAICRWIIESHGGRIWAESMPGSGSMFWFTLPLADSAHDPATT